MAISTPRIGGENLDLNSRYPVRRQKTPKNARLTLKANPQSLIVPRASAWSSAGSKAARNSGRLNVRSGAM